jgi:hypothetical protein
MCLKIRETWGRVQALEGGIRGNACCEANEGANGAATHRATDEDGG